MSRIRKLEPEQWPDDLRAAVKPEQLTPLEQGLTRFFAHRPELVAIRYTDGVNDGLTEHVVCSLERPQEADNLMDAEKAALARAGATPSMPHRPRRDTGGRRPVGADASGGPSCADALGKIGQDRCSDGATSAAETGKSLRSHKP